MATVIDKNANKKNDISSGDFILTENGWGIVSYAGATVSNEEKELYVSYFDVGYDRLSTVNLIKVVKNDDMKITLEY